MSTHHEVGDCQYKYEDGRYIQLPGCHTMEHYDKDISGENVLISTDFIYNVLDGTPNGMLDNTDVYTVPAGHVFAMGDNRDQSSDSRILSQLGFIPFDHLVGRAQIIFYSRDRSEPLWKLWLWPSSVRVERIFKRI